MLRRIGLKWVATVAGAVLVLGCIMVSAPHWWNWRARHLLAEFRNHRDDNTRKQLTFLLEKRTLSRDLGNEVLKELVSATVHVRQNYVCGRPVFVSLHTGSDLNLRHMEYTTSTKVLAGEDILSQADGEGSIRKGRFGLCEFPEGLRLDGKVVPLSQPGQYRGRIMVEFKVRPVRTKLYWPGAGPFPGNLLPVRISVGRPNMNQESVIYECKFDIPVDLKIVSEPDFKGPQLLSNSELDQRMKNTFQALPDSATIGVTSLAGKAFTVGVPLRNAIRVEYINLPVGIGLKAKYREADGQVYVSEQFRHARTSGSSGLIGLFEMTDIFEKLPSGKHEGELILFTDQQVAWDDPDITNLWSGSLSFPMDFIKP